MWLLVFVLPSDATAEMVMSIPPISCKRLRSLNLTLVVTGKSSDGMMPSLLSHHDLGAGVGQAGARHRVRVEPPRRRGTDLLVAFFAQLNIDDYFRLRLGFLNFPFSGYFVHFVMRQRIYGFVLLSVSISFSVFVSFSGFVLFSGVV